MILRMKEEDIWDIVVIGGGATGLGSALDAASRGYKTLLIEKYDFAKGTSGRSTKLVHGGVRYLQQGNIKLVIEALKERGRLIKNAPHLTKEQAFVLPIYNHFQKWYYGFGLMLYDYLSGKLSLGKTKILSKKKTMKALPALHPKKLAGGILYYDGQFDDARLAVDMAFAAAGQGAVILNYAAATGFVKEDGKITGVQFLDTIHSIAYTVKARAVINATGVFTDEMLQLDSAGQPSIILPSQGVHLVVDKKFFPGSNALIIPKTDDARVLFAVPWKDKVILGTTDTMVNDINIEPRAFKEEIAFIMHHFNRYCTTNISEKDILSVFAGLRPLLKTKKNKNSGEVSRDHTLLVSKSNLVTITGGKWTTYRKMAEDAVNNALFVGKLEKKDCITEQLPIEALSALVSADDPLFIYGKKADSIIALMKEDEKMKEKIHPGYPYTKAEIIWMTRNEMPQTVEDILARRIRLLLLDAHAAMECCEPVAQLMQAELHKDEEWKNNQVMAFKNLAQQYLV
jgi:glycerol-3-phosphate dehydrogenase